MPTINTIIFTALSALALSSPLYAATPQTDQTYMRLAINMGKHNPSAPFGAIIVDNNTGEVIAQGVNSTAASHNPILHGEMVAINDCVQKHPNVDWKHVTLYTTAEPCAMCQGAIIWAGIPRVVYGSSITFLKAIGWDVIDITASALSKKAKFYRGHVDGGILTQETNQLFKQSMEVNS